MPTWVGPVPLLGEAGSGSVFATMLRLFLVALVIVSPFAVRRYLVIRADVAARRRARAQGETLEVDEPAGGDESPGSLARVVAELEAAATATEAVVIEIPVAPTLSGRPAPDAVTRRIVADATRRSGLEVVAREELADGRTLLTVRPRRPGAPASTDPQGK